MIIPLHHIDYTTKNISYEYLLRLNNGGIISLTTEPKRLSLERVTIESVLESRRQMKRNNDQVSSVNILLNRVHNKETLNKTKYND